MTRETDVCQTAEKPRAILRGPGKPETVGEAQGKAQAYKDLKTEAAGMAQLTLSSWEAAGKAQPKAQPKAQQKAGGEGKARKGELEAEAEGRLGD